MFNSYKLVLEILKSKDPILESMNFKINQIFKYSYGWFDFKNNKKILPNSIEWNIPNYFEQNCRILSPIEVDKYKIGTCWDFSIYMADFILDKFNIQSDIYFICNKKFTETHTFLIFKYNDNKYICEPTVTKQLGISLIISDNIIDEIIKKYKKIQKYY